MIPFYFEVVPFGKYKISTVLLMDGGLSHANYGNEKILEHTTKPSEDLLCLFVLAES